MQSRISISEVTSSVSKPKVQCSNPADFIQSEIYMNPRNFIKKIEKSREVLLYFVKQIGITK